MELTPSSVLIGILIIALGSLVALDIANNYSDRYSEDLPEGFDFTEYDIRHNTTTVSDLMRDKMIGGNQTTDSNADFVDNFLRSTWEALKLSFRSLDFVSDLVETVSEDLNLPEYFTGILSAILIIAFLFTIIKAFFKIQGGI